jgi:hypothetical protein
VDAVCAASVALKGPGVLRMPGVLKVLVPRLPRVLIVQSTASTLSTRSTSTFTTSGTFSTP